jgi:ABC-2 type transport system permease protein
MHSGVSALADIARIERMRVLRDRAMLVLLFIFTLLAGFAVWTGGRWADARADAIAQMVAEADETMAKRRETFVKMVAEGEKPNFGLIYATAIPYRAGLPNAPLAALSAGEAEGYPAAASISPFVDPYSIFDAHSTGLENPAVLGAGRFDLAFVIVFLLPLLLIAATYDFWSRDVENGSARLQLAQPVRPASLILTRAAVRGGLLLVAATLVATMLLALAGPTDPAGLALFALIMLAYGAVWIALAAAINLFVRSSTTAALACGTAWLALVVLIPAALSATADLSVPPPSGQVYANATRAAGLEIRAANMAASRAAAKAESGRAYPATLWHSRKEIQQRDARLAPIHRGYAQGVADNRAFADAARFLSPAILAQDALDRIAGTDAGRALAFQAQACAFAGATRQLAFDWMDTDRLMTLADYDDGDLPRFRFAEPTRAAGLAIDLAALLLFVLLLLGLAAIRLRRGASAIL